PIIELYQIDVQPTNRQTMRRNLAKYWLTTTFFPSTTPPTASQSSTPAAFSSSPSNSQPPSAIWEKSQPPSVIGSTYLISYPVASQAMRARGVTSIHKTMRLYEDEDKLTMDVTWPGGTHTSQAIASGKVDPVTSYKTEDIEGNVVDIEDGGNSLS